LRGIRPRSWVFFDERLKRGRWFYDLSLVSFSADRLIASRLFLFSTLPLGAFSLFFFCYFWSIDPLASPSCVFSFSLFDIGGEVVAFFLPFSVLR